MDRLHAPTEHPCDLGPINGLILSSLRAEVARLHNSSYQGCQHMADIGDNYIAANGVILRGFVTPVAGVNPLTGEHGFVGGDHHDASDATYSSEIHLWVGGDRTGDQIAEAFRHELTHEAENRTDDSPATSDPVMMNSYDLTAYCGSH